MSFLKKKLLFIVNPRSGRGEARFRMTKMLETFTRAGYLPTVLLTQRSGEAAELVAQVGGEFDRVVCCGGDGTVNETLNGLMQLQNRPPLGIIPAGTTNDYSYTLHIPFNMEKAAANAVEDRLFDIDVGCFNGRFFTYVAAFGMFTEVTYETPQDSKNLLGAVAYVLEGAKRLGSIKSYHIRVEYDEGVIEDDVIVGLFTNTVSVAGMRTAFKDAKLDDGQMEITLIKQPQNFNDIQQIINILVNTEPMTQAEADFLRVVTTKHVRVSCDEPIAWTVDGESGGSYKVSEIHNVHRAVRVVTGDDTANTALGK